MNEPKAEIKEPKKYWTSLNAYNDTPEFQEIKGKEFLSPPLESNIGSSEVDRRNFLKLMAAGSALATAACFQRPQRKILPYINQPEEITMGIPNYYASTCTECSAGCGILVKTREGRPIKLEGNTEHPMSKGGMCTRGHSALLNLYDPDRLKAPVRFNRGSFQGQDIAWTDADKEIGARLANARKSGKKVAILSKFTSSPSLKSLMDDFLAGAKSEIYYYEPISYDDIIQAQYASYGTRIMPRYRFDLAKAVVSFDADYLGTWISPVEFTKQFSQNRKVSENKKTMSKVVTFESVMTLTGANSDLRVGIRPQDSMAIAMAVASELVHKHKIGNVDSSIDGLLRKYTPASVASSAGISEGAIVETANILAQNKSASLVVGGSAPAQNGEGLGLQVAINLLNSILQNDGVTVDYSVSPSKQVDGGVSAIKRLIADMQGGQIDILFIHGVNPAYSLPAEAGFVDACKKVTTVVAVDYTLNETSQVCDYALPDCHTLESWGDSEPQKDLYSLVQPTIRPIYSTRSFGDTLINLAKASGGSQKAANHKDFYSYVQTYWKENLHKKYQSELPFITFWENSLRNGVLDGVKMRGARGQTSSPRKVSANSFVGIPKGVRPADGEFSLVVYAKNTVFDGRSANNPWVQEFPDPITKMTWDNYALISKKTADKMMVTDGDVISIGAGDQKIKLPAVIQPGLHDQVVAVAMGYGRTHAGKIGNQIGQNIISLGKFTTSFQISGMGVAIAKTGAKHTLATTQEHHSMEGRPIIKEATLAEYKKNSHAGNEEHHHLFSLWPDHEYKGYRWGMSIDLNSCTGCGACVISCQAENNIPVVGKEQVHHGRIMHWMRIDRYFSGTPDNPEVLNQPMLCQHCENAPCETVCPVIATAHSDEGLNQQIYNRCVGTRYCANNCPYKVRRYNWFDYNYRQGRNYSHLEYPRNMAQNPEVTVRSRGIMEKCSFCTQRLSEAKNVAKDQGRTLRDGEVQTACQQSCPADAISFGNINDEHSKVLQTSKDARGYHVLAELNVKPSVTYLTKIRNVESEI